MKSVTFAALIAAALIGPAAAAGHGGHGSHGNSGGHGGYGWNGGHSGGSFGHPGFAPGWNNGHWTHGYNGARYGWWWTAGAMSYLYAQPVYPYPSYLPYDSGYYYGADDESSSYASPGYGELIQNNDPPSPYRYYCANPKGYYPEVSDCDDWQQIYLGSPANNEE